MLGFLKKTIFFWIISAALLGGITSKVEAANIVVSIKPIHSLVATITKGVSDPYLIIKGRASPHGFSLRPSDAKKIRNAQVIFWIGDEIETFLIKPLKTIGKRATIVSLSTAEGLTRLNYRNKEDFKFKPKSGHDGHKGHDDHKSHDDHKGHDHDGVDQHFWLDPANAIAFSYKIETTLQALDPRNAKVYSKNAKQLRKGLAKLMQNTGARMKPFKQRPFIVFHDAYQYFENRFGLTAAGSVVTNPELSTSAKQVSQIKKRIKRIGAYCVFMEPQFNPKLAKLLTRGTGARLSRIDPLGVDLKDGAGLYVKLIENISKSFEDCLLTTHKH